MSKYNKEWHAAHPGKHSLYGRRYALRKEYKMEFADFKELFDLQRGLCAICGQPEISKRRISIDHDHRNGKIRGLLCHRCNRVLGMMKENTEWLNAAIDYLNKAGEKTLLSFKDCKNCGRKSERQDVFCRKCGHEFDLKIESPGLHPEMRVN